MNAPAKLLIQLFFFIVVTLSGVQAASSVSPKSYINQAYELWERQEFDAAETLLHQAMAHYPDNQGLNFTLGLTLYKAHKLEQAIPLLNTLLTLHPNNHNLLYNTALILKTANQQEQAIPLYKKAMELAPDKTKIHYSLAKAYLATGQFKLGLPLFEHRFCDSQNYRKTLGYADITPTELAGKKVLIRAEWGLGDFIHFIRYAQLLKQYGATVIVQAFPPLMQLLSRCDYIDTLISVGNAFPTHDLQIPLLSLPLLFNTTAETIPVNIPYINADPELVDTWQKKLSDDANFKIGICWNAKPIYLENHPHTKRSIPLEFFAPLAKLDNVSLYSLQKIHGTEQLNEIDFAVHSFEDLDEQNGPFMDTAALIKNLDLVICADTSIVHVAGALGAPVWVLLPYTAEWRWMKDKNDTPWYPTMRLFRQTEPGNWEPVIAAIKKELVDQLSESITQKQKRAIQLAQNKQFNDACQLFQKLLAQNPHSPGIQYNTAYVLKHLGQMQEAIPLYKKVLTNKPQYCHAHLGLAQAYLATGNFIQGWKELEWRFTIPPENTARVKEYLNNNQDLSNTSILLNSEWGIGDTIQFVRYALLLKERGATIHIAPIQKALIPLLSLCPYIDFIVPPGDKQPQCDLTIPMINLPTVFATTVDTIPTQIPYLHVDKNYAKNWKQKLANDDNFKIGICWHGNTIHDIKKFMPLSYFAQLAQLPNVTVYSLQQREGLDQLDTLNDNNRIITFDNLDTSSPFMDTAAIMQQLDLIITVDTSIAHLAGALGRPVWVVLNHVADWRWMQERTDSPWYPTMRLFRQEYPHDWNGVIAQIIKELHAII